MVILVSIIVVTVALGTALSIGWLLKKLRERDERRDIQRLNSLKDIDETIKKYTDEQRRRRDQKEGQRD